MIALSSQNLRNSNKNPLKSNDSILTNLTNHIYLDGPDRTEFSSFLTN
jgi:hypothetical protein